ncbi:MAG: redoxin domain-containing protein [Clostridia bacterium]|nr:redoxin domain-containing protein [Clostridia bacterium]
MKKMALLISALLVVLLFAVGCGASQEEAVSEPETTQESVALEPDEAIDTSESGKVIEEVVVEETNDAEKFPAFKLKNLEEVEVTEALFAEHELTLVNIWGTTCPPCIQEMPELEKLQNDYADQGLKVLGIVADGNYLAAAEIVKALNVTYEHIVPDEDFARSYLMQFQFVPTTLFVNKEGVVVGEPIVGGNDYEGFESLVKEYMGLE